VLGQIKAETFYFFKRENVPISRLVSEQLGIWAIFEVKLLQFFFSR